jgi:hypothetical protein
VPTVFQSRQVFDPFGSTRSLASVFELFGFKEGVLNDKNRRIENCELHE